MCLDLSVSKKISRFPTASVKSRAFIYLAVSDHVVDAAVVQIKDTIQCPDSMITRVIVKFDGYVGKYLYHCHILEHEANDMMRPFEVVAAGG